MKRPAPNPPPRKHPRIRSPLRAIEQATTPEQYEQLAALLREQTAQRITGLLIEYAAAVRLPHDSSKSHDADAQ